MIQETAKEFFSFLFGIIKTVIIAAAIVIPIRYFIFQPFIVRGDSMLPNFHHKDYLLIDEISYRFREPERGEVIVFKPPNQPTTRYIKRIIGLPGEIIEISEGNVFVSKDGNNHDILNETDYLSESVFTSGNIKIVLEEDEFFVLGDNREFSSDSRAFGALSKENIVGRVFFRAFPFDSFSKIEAPIYSF